MQHHVWRDCWDGMPNVTVISETPVTEEGTVQDAFLFVLDPTRERVRLTDQYGVPRLFTLPREALGGTYAKPQRQDLPTQQENPQ